MSEGTANMLMRNLEPYKLPIASGVVGIVIGFLSKNVLKKETIRVSSMGSTLVSFGTIAVGTVIAEEIVKNRGRE